MTRVSAGVDMQQQQQKLPLPPLRHWNGDHLPLLKVGVKSELGHYLKGKNNAVETNSNKIVWAYFLKQEQECQKLSVKQQNLHRRLFDLHKLHRIAERRANQQNEHLIHLDAGGGSKQCSKRNSLRTQQTTKSTGDQREPDVPTRDTDLRDEVEVQPLTSKIENWLENFKNQDILDATPLNLKDPSFSNEKEKSNFTLDNNMEKPFKPHFLPKKPLEKNLIVEMVKHRNNIPHYRRASELEKKFKVIQLRREKGKAKNESFERGPAPLSLDIRLPPPSNKTKYYIRKMKQEIEKDYKKRMEYTNEKVKLIVSQFKDWCAAQEKKQVSVTISSEKCEENMDRRPLFVRGLQRYAQAFVRSNLPDDVDPNSPESIAYTRYLRLKLHQMPDDDLEDIVVEKQVIE